MGLFFAQNFGSLKKLCSIAIESNLNAMKKDYTWATRYTLILLILTGFSFLALLGIFLIFNLTELLAQL